MTNPETPSPKNKNTGEALPELIAGASSHARGFGSGHQSPKNNMMVIPEGYALVPIEPTQDMVDAAEATTTLAHNFCEADLIDIYKAMVLEFTSPDSTTTDTPEVNALPQDVINLVIAAREAFDSWTLPECESKALDKALEAFSERVPYENEPDATPEGSDANS